MPAALDAPAPVEHGQPVLELLVGADGVEVLGEEPVDVWADPELEGILVLLPLDPAVVGHVAVCLLCRRRGRFGRFEAAGPAARKVAAEQPLANVDVAQEGVAAALDHVLALPVEPAVRLHLPQRPLHRVVHRLPPRLGHPLAHQLHGIGVVGQPGERPAQVDVALAARLVVRHLPHRAVGHLVEAKVPDHVGNAVGGLEGMGNEVVRRLPTRGAQLPGVIALPRHVLEVEDAVGQGAHPLPDLIGVVGAEGPRRPALADAHVGQLVRPRDRGAVGGLHLVDHVVVAVLEQRFDEACAGDVARLAERLGGQSEARVARLVALGVLARRAPEEANELRVRLLAQRVVDVRQGDAGAAHDVAVQQVAHPQDHPRANR